MASTISLFWWRHKTDQFTNFGDEIGYHLVKRLARLPVHHSPMAEANFIACGSLMEMALDCRSNKACHVWGSGLMFEGPDYDPQRFYMHAVRGKLSAKRLSQGGRLGLGDPALLCSMLMKKSDLAKRWAVGVVPHYVDYDHPAVDQLVERLPHAIKIDPRKPVSEVLETVAACEFILSSSLHGLVVADGLEIPNQWIEPSANVAGYGYKFADYASIFDLPVYAPCRALEAIDEARISAWASAYQRPGLGTIQENLVRSFPRQFATDVGLAGFATLRSAAG